MSARLKLTPKLPPQTAAFKRFEKTNVELNRFYWTFLCATEYMLPAMHGTKRVRDVVKSNAGAHMDISSSKFISEYPETERVARHALLTLSITAFEDYMKDALMSFLIKKWKADKTYKINFKPQDIPAAEETKDWLRNKAIQMIVDEYMAKSYDSRFSAVSKLIVDYGASHPVLPPQAILLATQACEARNCIVHASGVLDERSVNALKSLIPGIKTGEKLDIKEPLLWSFLGALRDSARAIDIGLRTIPKPAAA